jgi:predicted O-methyltransferase YrrM
MPRQTDDLEALRGLGARAQAIPGFLSPREGKYLVQLVRATRLVEGDALEIGTLYGRSTVWIASAIASIPNNPRRLVVVDPFYGQYKDGSIPTIEAWWQTMRRNRVSKVVSLFPTTSLDAAENLPRPCSFAFIDGDHREESVLIDIALVIPRMSHGGIVAFHDVGNRNWPGVDRASATLGPECHWVGKRRGFIRAVRICRGDRRIGP